MRINTLQLSQDISAPATKVWAAIADWEGQSEWMLQTKVWVTSQQSEGVGTSIAAFTGPLHKFYPRFKSLGLLDLMEVTAWEPPLRCDVIHYGRIIRGTGSFVVEELSSSKSRFNWSEEIEAPALLFYLAKPFILLGVKISLARFARQLE
jgi:hypothetical protein